MASFAPLLQTTSPHSQAPKLLPRQKLHETINAKAKTRISLTDISIEGPILLMGPKYATWESRYGVVIYPNFYIFAGPPVS